MAKLRETGPGWQLSGIDASPDAVRHTRARGFEGVVEGSVNSLPFPAATFDGLVSLDVLYHAGVDQDQAVAEFARVLKPRGFLLLNLPAFPALAGRHDTAVSGVRRYVARDVRALLEPRGFRVDTLHYWNAWLFLPILAWRALSRVLYPPAREETKSDLSPLPRPLNETLAMLAGADSRFCRLARVPFGTSVFTCATLAP